MGWGWGKEGPPGAACLASPHQLLHTLLSQPPFIAHSQGTSNFLPPACPASPSRSENSFRCFLS